MIKFLNFKIGIISILFLLVGITVFAQPSSVDEIKQNIDNHSEKIKQLDEEIKIYSKQVEVVGAEAKNLQNAVKVLDINQKKIGTEIKKTETNIQKTNLVIRDLDNEVNEIEKKIDITVAAISKTVNNIHQKDDQSLIESLLNNKSLSEILDEYESIKQFQQKVGVLQQELGDYKDKLNNKKTLTESEKKKLLSLKGSLGDQNQIFVINKKEKNSLLITTKNKESEYKKIIINKQTEKEKFEQELFKFESELKRTIDPNSFPSAKKNILSPPLDSLIITQPFGKTIDSKRLYSSGTHNGVDFKAIRGTRILSMLDGIVLGTGNTDEQRGCYSYGKWILIEHPNGLSTMYAHLDLIKVSAGQQLQTGEIIGYTGQTGYATGPHLHLTLYASQGVEIQKYSASKNCKNVNIPIAPSNAYLDPMLYL